jgi:hypothetical protein
VFISSEIEHLQLRKQVLLMESELNRRTLELDWGELKVTARSSVTHIGSGLAGSIRKWGIGLAPVIGFFLVRRWISSKGLFVKGMLLWQTVKRVQNFWQFIKKS